MVFDLFSIATIKKWVDKLIIVKQELNYFKKSLK